MLRTRVFFFVIVGLASVLVGGAFLVERLNIFTLPTRRQEVVPIQVAVSPALFRWVETAAREFEAQRSDAQLTVVEIEGLAALSDFGGTDPASLPEAWLPEARFIAAMAERQGAPYAPDGRPVAASLLTWGAFESRATILAQQFGTLDWPAVHDAAESGRWQDLGGDPNWGFFKLTIASPTRSTSGLAALISAAAAYHDRLDLSQDDVTDPAFLAWLQGIVASVPNFNTLGPHPAETMAARGPSTGDVGLLLAADWHKSQGGLEKWEGFVTLAPRYVVTLDYPFTLRSNLDLDPVREEMARSFGDFLLGAERQARLSNEGFDPGRGGAGGASSQRVNVEPEVALSLFHWAQRERVGQ